jgi:hypothetical protein
MAVDRKKNFNATVTDAINDMLEHGFDSMGRVDDWQDAIRHAADESLPPEDKMTAMLRDGLTDIYEGLVNKGKIVERHPGLSLFTVNDLKPELRKLLDSRIMASANLIKLNRKQAIDKTLQRFSGWASSIPQGGTDQQKRAKVKGDMGKALKSLPFEERRVLIDQGHKLTSSINEVVAIGGQAIAARWRSHWRQAGYDYREDHRERDQEVYLLEDTWATRAGLVKPGNKGYYGQKSTKAGEEVFCRCFIVWIYALRDLPDSMLTVKGKNELDRVRAQLST